MKNGQFALYADKILSEKGYYRDYLTCKTDSAQFCAAMLADESLLNAAGFSKYAVSRISLTPRDDKLPAEVIIKFFTDTNILPMYDNIYGGFDEYRKYIRENYDHGPFVTYIFPEDERLLYAVSKITKPEKVFVAGSYYGYFAVWAMKAVRENNGTAVLSDINNEVCGLARENFGRLGYKNNAEIYCEDADALLARRAAPIDMLVLDATGRHDDPRPEYRGKRIYGALLKTAKRLLNKGSVIVIHNMEPENPDMQALVDELKSVNAAGKDYATYNGLGVYIVQ